MNHGISAMVHPNLPKIYIETKLKFKDQLMYLLFVNSNMPDMYLLGHYVTQHTVEYHLKSLDRSVDS